MKYQVILLNPKKGLSYCTNLKIREGKSKSMEETINEST